MVAIRDSIFVELRLFFSSSQLNGQEKQFFSIFRVLGCLFNGLSFCNPSCVVWAVRSFFRPPSRILNFIKAHSTFPRSTFVLLDIQHVCCLIADKLFSYCIENGSFRFQQFGKHSISANFDIIFVTTIFEA